MRRSWLWQNADRLAAVVTAIAALVAAVTNANVALRQTAIAALGEAGTNAAPAAAVLFECLLDTNESVRASARYSLSRIGPAAVPIVLEAFSTDDPGRRAAAIHLRLDQRGDLGLQRIP